MSAEIYSFKKHAKVERTKILITHDQPAGRVRIPDALTWKKSDESWKDFCGKLWMGAYENNGTDMIKLTVHLKLSESDRFMYELNQWASYAMMFDAGALYEEVNRRLEKVELHGVLFKFDLPE